MKERNSGKSRWKECENSSVVLDGLWKDDLSGSHPTHEMRLSWVCACVFVCLWICKYCSHYVMQASEPQQEGLWHVCFQQQISERRESYGDPPTADVNKRAKSRKHWPQTRSHCDLKRCVMDITENMPASLFTNLCAVNARQTWTNRDGDQLKLKPKKKKQQRKNRK